MYLLAKLSDNFQEWDKVTEEDYASLREDFPTLPIDRPTYAPGHVTILVTDDNKHLIVKHRLGIRISDDIDGKSAGQVLVKLVDRIEALEQSGQLAPGKGRMGTGRTLAELESVGAAVQIHVPDFFLMSINEVEVLDDACTDRLQEYLDDGWRILAVCPPNAARRPDYVLGRNKRLANRGENGLGDIF